MWNYYFHIFRIWSPTSTGRAVNFRHEVEHNIFHVIHHVDWQVDHQLEHHVDHLAKHHLQLLESITITTPITTSITTYITTSITTSITISITTSITTSSTTSITRFTTSITETSTSTDAFNNLDSDSEPKAAFYAIKAEPSCCLTLCRYIMMCAMLSRAVVWWPCITSTIYGLFTPVLALMFPQDLEWEVPYCNFSLPLPWNLNKMSVLQNHMGFGEVCGIFLPLLDLKLNIH